MARDIDVDAKDILSEIETCSLDGVPGGLIDATLGLRDGSLIVAGVASAFGVWTSLSVLGTALVVDKGVSPLGLSDRGIIGGVCETVRLNRSLLGVSRLGDLARAQDSTDFAGVLVLLESAATAS